MAKLRDSRAWLAIRGWVFRALFRLGVERFSPKLPDYEDLPYHDEPVPGEEEVLFADAEVTRTLYFGSDELQALDDSSVVAIAIGLLNDMDMGVVARAWGLAEEEVEEFCEPLSGALGISNASSIIRILTQSAKDADRMEAWHTAAADIASWWEGVLQFKHKLSVPQDAEKVSGFLMAALVNDIGAEEVHMSEDAYAQYRTWASKYILAQATVQTLASFTDADAGVGPVLGLPRAKNRLVH